MKPSYWKEIETAQPSHQKSQINTNYVTLDYALQQIGGRGYSREAKQQIPLEELQLRGANVLVKKLFGRFSFWKKNVEKPKEELSDLVADLALFTPAEKAQLKKTLPGLTTIPYGSKYLVLSECGKDLVNYRCLRMSGPNNQIQVIP